MGAKQGGLARSRPDSGKSRPPSGGVWLFSRRARSLGCGSAAAGQRAAAAGRGAGAGCRLGRGLGCGMEAGRRAWLGRRCGGSHGTARALGSRGAGAAGVGGPGAGAAGRGCRGRRGCAWAAVRGGRERRGARWQEDCAPTRQTMVNWLKNRGRALSHTQCAPSQESRLISRGVQESCTPPDTRRERPHR